MAITRGSTIRDVAAQVAGALENAGITAVLTGGSVVSIYSANKYQSYDIDFVTGASIRELTTVMAGLGFKRGAGRRRDRAEMGAASYAGRYIADPDPDTVREGPARRVLSLAGQPESRAGPAGKQSAAHFDARAGTLVPR